MNSEMEFGVGVGLALAPHSKNSEAKERGFLNLLHNNWLQSEEVVSLKPVAAGEINILPSQHKIKAFGGK
jgi:hypothetical protein